MSPFDISPPLPSLLPDRYELVAPLGSGAMGSVYRVRDRSRDEVVALKIVAAKDEEDRARLRGEIGALSGTNHENIVHLYEVGVVEDGVYFTMECIEGESLAAWAGRPPESLEEVERRVEIVRQLLAALEHLHSRGFLHRDVKPANVIVCGKPETEVRETSSPRVKLLDFGLATHRLAALTAEQGAAGTPLYMAAEQIAGNRGVDARADLYSTGAVLYHLLTGRAPFRSLGDALTHRSPPPPPHTLLSLCPESLSVVVMKLLAKERHRRYASAAETLEALDRALRAPRVEFDPGERKGELLPPSFVGRTRDLERLLAGASVGASGSGRAHFVTGESGIGRSSLLDESRLKGEAFAEFEAIALECRFSPSGERGGLRAFARDLLALLEAHWTSAEIARRLGPAFDAARYALQLRSTAEPDVPVATHRSSVLTGILGGLRLACETQPLLVLIDDAQHAEDLEREFVEACVNESDQLRGLVVVTFPSSSESDPNVPAWLTSLSERAEHTLRLGGLTDREVETMAEHMLSPRGTIRPELAAHLCARSLGRPAAVARELRALWDRGALAVRRQNERVEWSLLEREAAHRTSDAAGRLEARVDALATDERELLAVIAIAGAPPAFGGGRGIADAALAASVCSDSLELRAVTRRLLSRGLLVETNDGLATPSELDAEIVTAKLDDGRLAELHRALADGLIAGSGTLPPGAALRAARHYELAGHASTAAEHYLDAARVADREHAHRRARDSYLKAIDLSPAGETRSAAAEALGDFQTRLGELPAAMESFLLAGGRSTSDGDGAPENAELAPKILDKIGHVLHLQGEYSRAERVFGRCLDRAATHSHRARAHFRLGTLYYETGNAERARTHLEESCRLDESEQDFEAMARAQWQLGLVEKLGGQLEAATRRFELALESAERSGRDAVIATALNNLANIQRARGDDAGAIESLRRSISTRERIGDRLGLAVSLSSLGQVHHFRGEFAFAVERTEKADALFREVGDQKGVAIAQCNLGEVLRYVGEFARARETLERGMAHADEVGLRLLRVPYLCNLALLDADRGELERAADTLRSALRHVPDSAPPVLRANALGALTGVLIRTEEFEDARDALEECLFILESAEAKEKYAEFASHRVRLTAARSDPEAAVSAGTDALAACDSGVERVGRAHLHRELGRAYCDLGPDWADRTEKHLQVALEEYRDMKTPQYVAQTLVDFATYWRLLGEDEIAAESYDEATEMWRRLDAPRRLDELQTLRTKPQ